MLTIKNLYFSHQDKLVLNGIDLALNRGELLTILGANGAGKSTLLNCIAGLLKPQFKDDIGGIWLNNENLTALSNRQIARKIAYVSQSAPQTYLYTVQDYVALGRAPHLSRFASPSEKDYALVDQALDTLDIRHLADKIYMNMSGGEKQLVNIAKILVQQPQLILFDEPTSALDYGNVFKTIRLIKQLAEQNFSIITTTHNPDHPMLLHSKLPDAKVAILNAAGKLQVGNTLDIITEQNLTALYQTDLKLIYIPELQRHICAISHL
ncbi:iron complex transport system ATP-binding protein [Cricetibacter osteomyelitidis]|uniref:Iron complex transport system ATP-binding protein n=1 Tax=Cricetibacter osteomyelitidis TaxID=1521931 RepID=A0A4R2T445_9PAST|nr:ABC transporter ATP-binding protein [Cricetibacter osteomyelitidis]TCP97749.1 iron complex transport system ATP-binding protein [Cricetibacter osteomyelitidis]